jgi:hypothetical protein
MRGAGRRNGRYSSVGGSSSLPTPPPARAARAPRAAGCMVGADWRPRAAWASACWHPQHGKAGSHAASRVPDELLGSNRTGGLGTQGVGRVEAKHAMREHRNKGGRCPGREWTESKHKKQRVATTRNHHTAAEQPAQADPAAVSRDWQQARGRASRRALQRHLAAGTRQARPIIPDSISSAPPPWAAQVPPALPTLRVLGVGCRPPCAADTSPLNYVQPWLHAPAPSP